MPLFFLTATDYLGFLYLQINLFFRLLLEIAADDVLEVGKLGFLLPLA